MKPHKHAKLIKAWADGAEIQYKTNEWYDYSHDEQPYFSGDDVIRVKPDCEYAVEKIRKAGGDEAVYLYLYWLDGGEVEFKTTNRCWIDTASCNDDPFDIFIGWTGMESCYMRKKKHKVKQVLWICSKCYMDGESSYRPEVFIDSERDYPCQKDLMLEDYTQHCDMAKQTWHKVPTFTREVEYD